MTKPENYWSITTSSNSQNTGTTGIVLSVMRSAYYAKECQVEIMGPAQCLSSKRMRSPEIDKSMSHMVKLFAMYDGKKDEVNRPRLAVGGHRINFEGECSTQAANLLIVELLFDCMVSTPGAIFLGLDLKDLYLNTLMDRREYLKVKLAIFPDNVIAHYNLKGKVTKDGFLLCKNCKGMYVLLHTGLIAQQLLKKELEKHGYH